MNVPKRIKEDEEQIENDFEYAVAKFCGNCYCDISMPVATRILRFVDKSYWQQIPSTWPRNRILSFLNCIELVCKSIAEQYCDGSTCQNVSTLRKAIVERRAQLIEFLIAIVNMMQDRLITFASIRASTSCFILLDSKVEKTWIEKLCDYINAESPESELMCFSLGVMKNIIQWKGFSERIIPEEEADDDDDDKNGEIIEQCRSTNVACEPFECDKLKSKCVKSLHSRWTSVACNFATILSDRNGDRRYNVIEFLNLWRELVSVKSNGKIKSNEHFYRNIKYFLPSSPPNTIPPIVWRHIIDVVNEVLCYGTTISLQEEVDQNTRELTITVVNRVRNCHLLHLIPCSVGGPTGGYDMVLVKKATLMVIKAVAVMVRETKADSSSDSSAWSDDEEDENQEMNMIEGYVHETLRKLDRFVKSYSAFHPQTKIAQWIIQLFADRDDYLMESMVCCLDMSNGLCYRNNSNLQLQTILDPYFTFISFLEAIRFSHSVMLTLLTDDVCFFLYFYRMLKYIKRDPRGLIESCHEKDPTANLLIQVYGVLETLKVRVELLVQNRSYPPRVDLESVLGHLRACVGLIRMLILQ